MKTYVLQQHDGQGMVIGRTYYASLREARHNLKRALSMARDVDRLDVVKVSRDTYYVWNTRTFRGWFFTIEEADVPDDSPEAKAMKRGQKDERRLGG